MIEENIGKIWLLVCLIDQAYLIEEKHRHLKVPCMAQDAHDLDVDNIG